MWSCKTGSFKMQVIFFTRILFVQARTLRLKRGAFTFVRVDGVKRVKVMKLDAIFVGQTESRNVTPD